MNIANLQKEVEKNLESQIKRVFRDAIDNDGDFDIFADYETHMLINDLVEKIGLEVCGMYVRPSEFIIDFEFKEKYSSITNFPLRECHISLQNDGNYYLTIDNQVLQSDWWLNMTDSFHNFQKMNDTVANQVLNDMNKVIEFNYLSLK